MRKQPNIQNNLKKRNHHNKPANRKKQTEDLFEQCIKKGLIEKTEYGYIFKPEFFETHEIYEDE